MANNETRINQSNTFEEFRQKTNEISLNLGANDLLDTNLSDRSFNFVATGGETFFTGTDGSGKEIRYELYPQDLVDNVSGYIIFAAGTVVPSSFIPGAIVTQTNGYSATITSISDKKMLVKLPTGEFDSRLDLSTDSHSIDNANLERIIGESYNKGSIRVYKNGVELTQSIEEDGFHPVMHAGTIQLIAADEALVENFTEGSLIYQGSAQANASLVAANSTWYGTVLKTSTGDIKVKTSQGTFSPSIQIRLLGSNDTIPAAKHGVLESHDVSVGRAIELVTPLEASDTLKVFSMDLVSAINELQDDVGIVENLNTTQGDLVKAVNEHEADLFGAEGANKRNLNSLLTGVKTSIVDSLNELHTELYTSGVTFTGLSSTNFQAAVNELRVELGDHADLTTTATNAINAIIELEADLFGAEGDNKQTLQSLTTATKNSIISAINEHEAQIGNESIGSIDTDATTTITGALNQLHAEVGDVSATNMGTDASNITAAIKEHENQIGNEAIGTIDSDTTTTITGALNQLHDEIGDVTAANMGTSAANITAAIKEHEDQIGNTDITGVDSDTNTITGALVQLHDEVGDVTAANMGTSATNITNAIKEHEDQIGDVSATNMGTTASDITNAIKEHETDLFGTGANKRTLSSLHTDTTASIVDSINEVHKDVGDVTFDGQGPANTLVGEVDAANVAGLTLDPNYIVDFVDATDAINAIDTEIGDTTYTGDDITSAIKTAQDLIGTEAINTLDGDSITTITGALNQLHGEVGDVTAANMGTTASNITAAIKEVVDEKVYLTSATSQTITSPISFVGDHTHQGDITFNKHLTGSVPNKITLKPGTVLDLSEVTKDVSDNITDEVTLLLPGSADGVSFFGTPFIGISLPEDSDVTKQGFLLDRSHVDGADDIRPALIWDENITARDMRWQLTGLEAGTGTEASNTASIVTFYNAKNLIANNTESGINVSWDSATQTFDFNVNDPTITLSGDVTGTATMTNLGNVTIATTIQPNSVALGTDTSGNYVKSVVGTTNEVEISGNSGDDGRTITVGLPDNVTINDLHVSASTESTSATTGAFTVTGGAGIGKDLYVGGDLYVAGDKTILNTSTIEVEDTLILAGNGLTSEPTSGGFGVEVGPIVYDDTNRPATIADNVTGAHSIVYNYSADRWEADGSLILSEATLGTPGVWNTAATPVELELSSSRAIRFKSGSGLTRAVALNGSDIDVTYTNSDKGSSQNIFKNVQIQNSAGTSQGTAVADNNNDTLILKEAGAIDLTHTGDTISIAHADTSTLSGNYGNTSTENGVYIKSVTVDGYGHVTGVTSDDFDNRYDNYGSWTARDGDSTTYTITSGDTLQYKEGTGMDVNFTADDVLTFTNSDRGSSQNIFKNVAVTNNNVYAAAANGTVIADSNDDTLNMIGGGAINIAANATTDTLTISHDNTSSVANHSVNNSGNTFIQDITTTFDTYGHVTGFTTTSATVDTYDGWKLHVDGAFKDLVTQNEIVNFKQGGAIDLAYSTTNNTVTISHEDTSSQASVDNTGNTFIQDITLDTYGHITAITSAAASLPFDNYGGWDLFVDGTSRGRITSGENVDFVQGGAIDLAYSATNNKITISHEDTSSQASVNNSGNTFIQDITLDTYGHITAITSATASLPFDNYGSWTAKDHDGTTYTITSGDTLQYKEGSGMDVDFTADDVLTFTNTDRGSSQHIFKNVEAENSAGTTIGTAVADTNNDTLTFRAGTNVTLAVDAANDRITISSTDTNTTYSKSTSTYLGLVKTGFTTNATARNYAVQMSGDHAYVNVPWVDTDTNTWRGIHNTPVDGATTTSISSNWAFGTDAFLNGVTIALGTLNGKILTDVPANAVFTDTYRPIHNTPVDGATTTSISSDWAFDNVKKAVPADAVFTDTNTTYSTATSSTLGLVKVGYTENGKNYPVELSSGKMYVNVPWVDTNTDTNTTYTAGTGLTLSGTQFSVTENNIVRYDTDSYFTIGDLASTIYFEGAACFGFASTGNFTAKGNITAHANTITSDAKYKKNVETIEGALDKVKSMRGVTYQWNEKTSREDQKDIGVIAQEMEKVCPEVVVENESLDNPEESFKSVDYGKLVGVLIEAVKELSEEVERLKSK